MSEWRTYPKKTGPGRWYLYRQRNVKGADGRWHTESYSLGRINGGIRQKRNVVGQMGMAVFGVEDEFGERVDSLWNRHVNKDKKAEAAKEEAAREERPETEDAGAGNGEEPSE